ncbi:MAG: DNA-protecting protein DprA [Deltaproteobacteria bacterium]|nr:DNA-protecting protein DprA [Deltaproteobacteria bacterium]
MSPGCCLSPSDESYPRELREIPDSPKQLFLAGRLPPGPRVAVVGARRCDAYGIEVATELGVGLAKAGVPVISGGAEGVDTAVLKACLEAGGKPVAVLGTGLDQAYPVGNRSLFSSIAEQGALLSEYPEGTPGRRAHFPRRNRLISGLSEIVVVVRAAPKSGSLITARLAVRQGRRVAAVPGQVAQALSQGVHALLRQGASLVEGSEDVLALLGRKPVKSAQSPREVPPPPSNLGEDAKRVFAVLSPSAMTVDMVASGCGLTSAQVVGLLLQLEFEGLAEHCPGTMYRKVTS